MSRALTVYLKPEVLQHPDYIKFNSRNSLYESFLTPSDIGPVFQDKDRYLSYVSVPNIGTYIEAQAAYIDEIDWKILKDPENKGSWPASFVEEIAPFDNTSFWIYVPHRLQSLSVDFIRRYAGKVNFTVDQTTDRYAGQTRQFFSFPAKLSLSQREDLPWSVALLEEFSDRWNWRFLSLNEGIKWDESLINHFVDKVSFHALSARADLPWTAELLTRYADKWDWLALSGNPGLPWSYQLLKSFEDKWTWQRHIKRLDYLRGNSYIHLKPSSISHNSGIRWSNELKEFISKVDIWSLAANAFLTQKFIALVADQLSVSRVIYSFWRKYSDYPLEEENVERTGWDFILEDRQGHYKDAN